MSTAAAQPNDHAIQVAEREPALPFRNDTLLGVCEALGQDLGVNPNWLRVPFAALILWNPPVIVASYLALGCVVAVTRLALPDRRSKPAPQADAEAPVVEAVVVEKVEKEKELLAA